MSVWDELSWRGLIADSTDAEALRNALEGGTLTFYVGFDPTAPSLHLGHLLQLRVASLLQEHGHRPILVVGGATGLIGDPKESGERSLNDAEVVAQWTDRIRRQVSKFVRFDGPTPATVVSNLEWTGEQSAISLLRDVGKHFPVNRMLDRELVARRLSSEGLSFTEFAYVLLQAQDYLELYRRHGCTLQFGGSDQWGNITAGVDLVRRATGAHVHALSTPLLTKADGTKFGKTEGGAPWIDPDLLSPWGLHQLLRNIEDAKVLEALRLFTSLTPEQIDELDTATREEPYKRRAQQVLADEVTAWVHSPEAVAAANAASQAVFGRGDLEGLDEPTLRAVASEVGGGEVPRSEVLGIVDALVSAGVETTKSAARRTISEGGAYVNNIKVNDPDLVLSDGHLLAGRFILLRRGRKTVRVLTRP